MNELQLPKSVTVDVENEKRAKITIQPLHPGYGTTIGNSLRRVLLSSLPGSAVTAIKIKGAQHEFSALDGVIEDVVEIILNIKALRLKSHALEPVKITIDVKGEKEITAADIEKNSDVEVIDPHHHIATLTDPKAQFKMDMWVDNGLGYAPVENREDKKSELGVIEIDAIFSPVRTVNFEVENMRVGQVTDYNQLILDIHTDGSISPEQAFHQASQILVDHFSILTQPSNNDGGKNEQKEAAPETETPAQDDAPAEETK